MDDDDDDDVSVCRAGLDVDVDVDVGVYVYVCADDDPARSMDEERRGTHRRQDGGRGDGGDVEMMSASERTRTRTRARSARTKSQRRRGRRQRRAPGAIRASSLLSLSIRGSDTRPLPSPFAAAAAAAVAFAVFLLLADTACRRTAAHPEDDAVFSSAFASSPPSSFAAAAAFSTAPRRAAVAAWHKSYPLAAPAVGVRPTAATTLTVTTTKTTKMKKTTRKSRTELCGIRGFRAWFESAFPDAVTRLPPAPRRSSSASASACEDGRGKGEEGLDDDGHDEEPDFGHGCDDGRSHSWSRGEQQRSRSSSSSRRRRRGGGRASAADKSTDRAESFDHVLVDVNQLLHTSVRRATSESHSLLLVVRELDRCLEQCRPLRSVVLAFDGPPSAAKLATQRTRRYGVLTRGEQYKRQLEYFARRGVVGPGHEDWDEYLERVITGEDREEEGGGGKKDDGDGDEHAEDAGGVSASASSSSSSSSWTPWSSSSSSWPSKDWGSGKKKGEKLKRRGGTTATRLERYARDERTLRITPGTEYLERAESAFLYWAWQRLSNRRSRLSQAKDVDDGIGGVRVYLSPSKMPGEGEVKLLDWLYQASEARVVLPSHSVAILGGDSDLVVQGLVVPPRVTHNIFVILPREGKGTVAYCISLWETTRTLAAYLPKLRSDDMMRVRTDLVVLLIMNGNDYLPKLRGSSGFNKLFHTYLRLLKEWLDDDYYDHNSDVRHGDDNPKERVSSSSSPRSAGRSLRGRRPRPFLVDPDRLEYNLPFCLSFFRRLASQEPNLAPVEMMGTWRRSSMTPLSGLNNLVDGGFLPRPVAWEIIPWDGSGGGGRNGGDDEKGRRVIIPSAGPESDAGGGERSAEAAVATEGRRSSADYEEKEIVRLTLGNPSSSSGNDGGRRGGGGGSGSSTSNGGGQFYSFETFHRAGRPIQKTKQLLAAMALEELIGKDYMIMHDYDLDNLADYDDDHDYDHDDRGRASVGKGRGRELNRKDDEEGDDDDNGEEEMFIGPASGYDWEVQTPAAANVERYLEGIIWNLQTYEDGICPNYAYNYGRRMSPGAGEVVEYLKTAKTLGPEQLYPRDAPEVGGASSSSSSSSSLSSDDYLGGSSECVNGWSWETTFVPPLNAGLSCLAALPVQVRELIPEPYRWLADSGEVEDIYASCMDSESNVFSIEKFRSLCEQRIAEMMREGWDGIEGTVAKEERGQASERNVDRGGKADPQQQQRPVQPPLRKIRTGSTFWTVLSKAREPLLHPFAPPDPFSENLSELYPSKWVRASRIMATDVPPRRQPFHIRNPEKAHGSPSHRKILHEKRVLDARSCFEGSSHYSSMSPLVTNIINEAKETILLVPYKRAFFSTINKDSLNPGKPRVEPSANIWEPLGQDRHDRIDSKTPAVRKKHKKKRRNKEGECEDWLRRHNLVPPPDEPARNVQNQTSVTCLQQLQDSRLLSLRWEMHLPSESGGDAISPETYETVTLIIISDLHDRANGDGDDGEIDEGFVSKNSVVYEQVRNVNFVSRRAMKQHLASIALTDAVGKDWIYLTFKEMKQRLQDIKAGFVSQGR